MTTEEYVEKELDNAKFSLKYRVAEAEQARERVNFFERILEKINE
jgi:hypothetical protein